MSEGGGENDKPKSVTFVASLPPIQSAISIDGLGEGARLKLDVPASDLGAVLLLQHYGSGKPLKITVEFLDDDCFTGSNNNALETRPKRKSKWKTAEKPSTH